MYQRILALVFSLIVLFSIAPTPGSAAAKEWILEENTLSYHVSHPLHQIDGVSHAARGKSACDAGQCDFLIAVPVKTFDSGDSNRDLHMLQATRGAQFPLISVRTKLPETAIAASGGTIQLDLEIQFAGQTAQYKQVAFQLAIKRTKFAFPASFPRRFLISRSTRLRCCGTEPAIIFLWQRATESTCRSRTCCCRRASVTGCRRTIWCTS